MKVWMVHRESGAYSDWTYDIKGVFSSYAKAREYLKGLSFKVGRYKDDTFWDTDADYMHYDVHDTATLFTTDGKTFMYKVAGSDVLIGWIEGYGNNLTYYITEYELDKEV